MTPPVFPTMTSMVPCEECGVEIEVPKTDALLDWFLPGRSSRRKYKRKTQNKTDKSMNLKVKIRKTKLELEKQLGFFFKLYDDEAKDDQGREIITKEKQESRLKNLKKEEDLDKLLDIFKDFENITSTLIDSLLNDKLKKGEEIFNDKKKFIEKLVNSYKIINKLQIEIKDNSRLEKKIEKFNNLAHWNTRSEQKEKSRKSAKKKNKEMKEKKKSTKKDKDKDN